MTVANLFGVILCITTYALVRYCGQGSSLVWTPALRPCVVPVH